MSVSDTDLLALIPRAPEKRTTSEICERLSRSGKAITARSVQRRLINLSDRYPVVSDERSKPYGWSIEKDAAPTIGAISLQEAIALKMGERHLKDALPLEVVDDLRPYFELADNKLKASKLYQAWMKKIRLVPPAQALVKPRIGRRVLSACYDAVLKSRRLHLVYEREAGRVREYEVNPQGVILRGPVTYLVVTFDFADDPSLLAMHRIKNARMLETESAGIDSFDIDAFIQKGGTGFLPEGEETLKVHFLDGAGNHLFETPFSENQVLKEIAPGEHTLTVKTQITQQLKWWLLGFGERVKVVAPSSLRREFAGKLAAAAKLYC